MDMKVKVRVIIIIAIAAIAGSATANFAAANSVPPPIPHGVWGFVNDINGIPAIGADVTLTNTNTSESIKEITASDGSYTFGVENLPSGCTDGDELLIHAKSSTHEGNITLVVNNSFTTQRADNITLSTPIPTPTPPPGPPIAVPEYNIIGVIALIALLAIALGLASQGQDKFRKK